MMFQCFRCLNLYKSASYVIAASIVFVTLGCVAKPTLAKNNLNAALDAVKKLPPKKLIRLNMLLVALGVYKDRIGIAGLETVKGIIKFQKARRLRVTGIPDQRTFLALEARGGPILKYFGFKNFKHPSVGSLLGVPVGLIAESRQTSRGLLFEGLGNEISVDFSFVSRNRGQLDDLFSRLSRPTTGRRILHKTIEDSFFVITGFEQQQTYIVQYHAINAGFIGYTLRFNPTKIRYGDKLAFLMGSMFTPSPSGKQIAGKRGQSGPSIQTGSGFFVTASGMGITNHHVIKGCRIAEIKNYGTAEIIAFDQINDLAILRLKSEAQTVPVLIRKRKGQLGENIFALGFPLSGLLKNNLNFTSGVISSLSGVGNDSRILQFTAPIQPGNSGGPLVDNTGSLIGVVRAKLNDVAALKTIGSVPQNVNFAIRSQLLLSFLAAHNIEPKLVETKRSKLSTAEVAAEGQKFTFQVSCQVTKRKGDK